MLTTNQFKARVQLVAVVVFLMLMGLVAHWSHQDKANDASFNRALAASIKQHAYNNQVVVDEATAQCIGR